MVCRKEDKIFKGLLAATRLVDSCVWRQAFLDLQNFKICGKKDADLIVMGSHAKEKDGKWYVGSSVERISYRSICPVIVIADPKVLLTMD